MSWMNQLEEYSQSVMETYTSQLVRLVKIPSISAHAENREDLFKILEEMGNITSEYGMRSEIIETEGAPVFLAELETDPNAPWILIYNHMDVQPANEPQWITKPFEPVVKDGRIIGRGSTDDKGPALSIIHAIHFLASQKIPLPNIQVVYETEEEIGSPYFGAFLDQNRDKFRNPQSILVSDTIFEGSHPAITYSLKGMARFEIELKTGSKDLHSGVFGNAVENPLNLLVRALATCVDAKGRILIPEMLADIAPPTDRENFELRKVAEVFDLEGLKRDSAFASLYSENALDILDGVWRRPTFEIHGFEGAQWEPGVLKSALPYHVKAKVSTRLVPGQNPKRVHEQLEKHLKKIDHRIGVKLLSGQSPAVASLDNPFMDQAIEACKTGFGEEPLFVGCGGTIGAIPEMQRVFPWAPVVLIAQSLMSDGYHAPNEEFRLSQACSGMKTMASYLNRIATLTVT